MSYGRELAEDYLEARQLKIWRQEPEEVLNVGFKPSGKAELNEDEQLSS